MAHSGSRRTRIAALIGGLIVAAAPARAADVPASAYSVAVQTPIVLLDDANLVYLFPQHGTSLATQLQMSANGSSAHAAGGNMRFGRQAGFLLGRRGSRPEVTGGAPAWRCVAPGIATVATAATTKTRS